MKIQGRSKLSSAGWYNVFAFWQALNFQSRALPQSNFLETIYSRIIFAQTIKIVYKYSIIHLSFFNFTRSLQINTYSFPDTRKLISTDRLHVKSNQKLPDPPKIPRMYILLTFQLSLVYDSAPATARLSQSRGVISYGGGRSLDLIALAHLPTFMPIFSAPGKTTKNCLQKGLVGVYIVLPWRGEETRSAMLADLRPESARVSSTVLSVSSAASLSLK